MGIFVVVIGWFFEPHLVLMLLKLQGDRWGLSGSLALSLNLLEVRQVCGELIFNLSMVGTVSSCFVSGSTVGSTVRRGAEKKYFKL